MKRTIGTVTAGLLVSAAAIFTGGTAAHAGTCDGSACNGQSPTDTGCAAGAYVPQNATVFDNGVKLELWYSPACHANWAEMDNASYGWTIYVHNENGDSESAGYWGWNGGTVTTSMVNGYPMAEAHFGDGTSTGWH